MIAFPKAKINLGLNVLRKRPDGFHEIESVMVPIPLFDALEAVVDPGMSDGEAAYARTGVQLDGDSSNDLVMRAHALLSVRRALPGIRLHLHKHIPAGAGLGGGSSDGTTAILLLDRLLGLRLAKDELMEMAAQLGSDCAFFLKDCPQLAEGRGERLTPVQLDLAGIWLYLVNPGIHISTKEAFALTQVTERRLAIAEVLASQPMEQWSSLAPNVMQPAIAAKHPAIACAIEQLAHAGARHAAMSGSGSTVFGLFASCPAAISWPEGHRSWILQLG
ncbi:MAG: 4-(cytidine 5'-diphospho)-2-C-methyl-D-erythritol kinase [Flavobacteriales bacterium]|nr:4-(cytidine 5'-diphospho)-2-C-methyl-D-erythritol kinase [Flavobacteriales bacterium]